MTISRSVVNNALRDPIQGFDCDVIVLDQGTGKQLIVGRFVSFQETVRNATEPYMEFNQRIARLLDGEFQFGWVLERGLIDVRVLEDTFGLPRMTREQRISRSPRFQISVEINAPELDESGGAAYVDQSYNSDFELLAGGNAISERTNRKAIGTYRLLFAKPDALTKGFMAGRAVVATRWEGLCEGIEFIDSQLTIATNKNTVVDGKTGSSGTVAQGTFSNTFSASANPFAPSNFTGFATNANIPSI